MLTLEQIEAAAREKTRQIPDSGDGTRVTDLAALVADLAAHMREQEKMVRALMVAI